MKKINSLFTPNKDITMTPEEKQKIWGVISARTFEIDADTTSVRKPFLSRLYYGGLVPIMSYQGLFLQKRKYALSAIVVVLVTSAGFSIFAEESLPGERLYAVKTNVNERIKNSFAFTPEAKALVEAKLATKRLEEIEGLALKAKLNAALAQETNEAFNVHVAKLAVHLNELESEAKFGEVAKVGVFFQTRVAVHAAVLKDMEINQKILSSTVSPQGAEKEGVLRAISHLEKKVLTTTIPVILVTKKALAVVSPSSEIRERDEKNPGVGNNKNIISLDIDSEEAQKYLTELHVNVGAPLPIMGTPLPAIVPVFVP